MNSQAKQQHEELKQKLLDEVEPQTLQQQENISIKGSSARHLVMQKLMRKAEVSFLHGLQINRLELFVYSLIINCFGVVACYHSTKHGWPRRR